MPDSCRLVVPAVFTHTSFEYFLNQLPAEDEIKDAAVILDLSLLSSVSSYGVLALLVLSNYLQSLSAALTVSFEGNERIGLLLNEWGFFSFSKGISANRFLAGGEEAESSDVFLKVVPVRNEEDIYTVIDFVRDNIFLPQEPVNDLVVAISEISQNILEHSMSTGFICISRERQSAGRRAYLNVCIVDSGIGIGSSLENKLAACEKDYIDGAALYKTFFEGVSRYDDPGRGNGIIKTRDLVARHRGKMMVRSGRAKVWGAIPSWQIERFLRKRLRYLPGTQVSISFPLRTGLCG